jgi:hypothetical protein
MSSRKAAAAKVRPASSAKPKAKPVAAKPVAAKPVAAKPSTIKPSTVKPVASKPAAGNGVDVSAEAIRLAAEIEREFAKRDDALTPEAMQTLMAALCRVYAAQVENGSRHTPIPEGQVVNPTGVMLTASGLLRAANLAVFELGMWQSWTGK